MPARITQTETVTETPVTPEGILITERLASGGGGCRRVVDYSTNRVDGSGTYVFATMLYYDDRVEVWRYGENTGFQRIQTFTVNDPRLVGFSPRPETREESQQAAESEYQEIREAQRRRDREILEERDRRLRQGNHWVVTTHRDPASGRTTFVLARDAYATATQQQAKDTYLRYIKEEKRNRFREINRMMNQLEVYKKQEEEVKAIPLWPDPKAESYTPERGAQ